MPSITIDDLKVNTEDLEEAELQLLDAIKQIQLKMDKISNEIKLFQSCQNVLKKQLVSILEPVWLITNHHFQLLVGVIRNETPWTKKPIILAL